MATVAVKIVGGTLKEITASTLGEVKSLMDALNHQATINGEVVTDDDFELESDAFITLAPKVKGA